MKAKTKSWWIKKADGVFSKWVKSQGDTCYTCGVRVEGSNKQAGHFFSRQHHSVRFSEENVRIQCFRCNIWLRGNAGEFAVRLLKEIGQKKFNELAKQKNEIKQWSIKELKELCERYKHGDN